MQTILLFKREQSSSERFKAECWVPEPPPPHAAKVLKANFPSSFTVFLGLSVFSAIFKKISLKSQKSKKFQKSLKPQKVPKV